jgi:hypothetical protein
MTYALEEAVELLGVDAVGSLHFAVEPMRARPDADVADAFVDQVPVERGAEPLAVVGLYLVDVEWQLGQHVVDEGDGGDLLVAGVGPQDPQSGAVIDRGVLVVAPPAALRPSGSMNLTSACRCFSYRFQRVSRRLYRCDVGSPLTQPGARCVKLQTG